MSAKKVAAKKAAKPAAKKTAKTAAQPAAADQTSLVEDGTEIVFTGFATPIEGQSELNIGDRVFVSSYNDDDGSYNVSRTPKGAPVDTLFRKEFRLASEPASAEEVAKTGQNGGAPLSKATKQALKKPAKQTDAEADAGTRTTGKSSKDAEGRTVTTKAPKEKKEKPAPKPIVDGPVKLLPSIKALVSESNGDLIATAEALADRVGSTEYTLGGVLAKIAETGEFENIKDSEGNPAYGVGQPGFSKFVEQHLGMKYRKAIYLVGNYTAAVAAGVTEKQMAGIGWSKFKEAVAVLTVENKDEILAEAKSLPYDDFKAAMKKRLINGGGKLHGNTNTADLRTFTFKLHNDKGQVLVESLEKAKSKLGITGDDVFTASQALDLIVSEWFSMQD